MGEDDAVGMAEARAPVMKEWGAEGLVGGGATDGKLPCTAVS